MKKTLTVQMRFAGLNAEKLLNAARAQGIPVQGVRREKDRSVTVQCARGDAPALRALAAEKGYQVSRECPAGAFLWIGRWAKRRGLLIGAVLGAAAVFWALGFVWQVRVENAGAYAGEVRAYLRELGIEPGIRRSQVDLAALREKLEWRLPQVKWVWVEWTGVALRVRLEEGTPPPDVEPWGGAGDVVAAEDGLLLRLTVYAGTPAAHAGDFVRRGQVLIRGEERGAGGDTVPVKARGEAVARVWVTVRRRLPLEEAVSVPTGRQEDRWTMETPFFSWSSRQEPAYLTADREVREIRVGGAWLPVTVKKESISEVFLKCRLRDLEAVKREGARAALLALRQALISDEIVDKWLNFSMIKGDTIEVEATAEVWRDIGRCRRQGGEAP